MQPMTDLARKLKKAIAAALIADKDVNTAKSESRRRHAEQIRREANTKLAKAIKRNKRAKTQKQMRDLGINY
jgi:hypothetical protein